MKLTKELDGTYTISDIDEQMAAIFAEMNSGLEEDYFKVNRKMPEEPGSVIFVQGPPGPSKFFRLTNGTWISPFGTQFNDSDFDDDEWEEV